MIAEVVLAELARGVAQVLEESGEARGAWPQVGKAARQLRRDHAGARYGCMPVMKALRPAVQLYSA